MAQTPPAPKPANEPMLQRVVRLHGLLLAALLTALLVGAVTPGDWGWPTRAAAGWDAGVLVFLVLVVLRLARTRSTDQIRSRAAALDDAGSAVLPLSILAACASIAIVIGEAATASRADAASSAVLALGTVALSWCFIHLIFALHYAHAFYASAAKGKGDRGGLLFPGEAEPDYWDFIHFSLIIGVACQTADIQISDRRLRRISSIHSATAFVFNTVIIALGVNFAISLIGG